VLDSLAKYGTTLFIWNIYFKNLIFAARKSLSQNDAKSLALLQQIVKVAV
jgi:hypothetical protein